MTLPILNTTRGRDATLEAWGEYLQPVEEVFSPAEREHFQRWCEVSGILPEGPGGVGFTLQGREYARELYDETWTAPRQRTVRRKAAQLGLTVLMLYRGAWLTSSAQHRRNVGFMFPTRDEVHDLHKTRFRPMMRSSARMMRLIERGEVDAVESVRIANSNMRFRGMRTGTAVDSFPADALLFDEVRLMSVAMIERAFLRISESNLVGPNGQRGIIDLNSTAGFPGNDIDYYFQRSDQRFWHVRCPRAGCKNHSGFIMEFAWPECVDPVRMRYICPRCGAEIENPQRDGHYHGIGPADAYWRGWSFSKILKGPEYLPEMWRAYQGMVVEGQNPSEFFNSYLALPHRDPNAVLVTGEVFDRSMEIEPTYRWPAEGPHREGWFTSMGIDQRGVEKHVTLLRLGPGGRVYGTHLEVVERSGQDAVRYCAGLARAWHVDVVVCDAMPSYDFAADLGRALPTGTVWLAEYSEDRDQPLEWNDQGKKAQIRKSTGEAKYRHLVTIDRYKHLLAAFNLFRNNRLVMPRDAMSLTQELSRKGTRAPVALAYEMREHLENIARVAIERTATDPETKERIHTGKYRYTFRHLAVEPHWAHSYGYAVAGVMRRMGTTTVTAGERRPDVADTDRSQQVAQLPAELRPRRLSKRYKRACASCKWFRANPDGGLGWCDNARVALGLNAHPPIRTSSGATNCRHHEKRLHDD